MNKFDGCVFTNPNIAAQVICPRCETVHVGTDRPDGWQMVKAGAGYQLLCPDCIPPAKRRARKGGAA